MISSLWHRPVASLRRSSVHFYRWFQSPVGQEMLSQELELIELCRREHKGDLMVQITGSSRRLLGKPSRKRKKIMIAPQAPMDGDQELAGYSWLISDIDRIPLQEGSVDFLVLHHVLEFSENPHSVLREASRVLAPQGHLVIICFNPYSLFGLRKSFQLAWRRQIPWAHHGLSSARLSDWLHLMSCEPTNKAAGFYGFPIQSQRLSKWMAPLDRWMTRWGFLGGGFYVIHACKEVMTPLDSKLQKQSSRLIEFPAVSAIRTGMNRK